MAIEEDAHGNMSVTGEHIELYRLLALKHRLSLEVRTGIPYSNRGISTLQAVQRAGITAKRTRKGAMKDLDKYIKDKFGDPDKQEAKQPTEQPPEQQA